MVVGRRADISFGVLLSSPGDAWIVQAGFAGPTGQQIS
jgi:hypothetical protein